MVVGDTGPYFRRFFVRETHANRASRQRVNIMSVGAELLPDVAVTVGHNFCADKTVAFLDERKHL